MFKRNTLNRERNVLELSRFLDRATEEELEEVGRQIQMGYLSEGEDQ